MWNPPTLRWYFHRGPEFSFLSWDQYSVHITDLLVSFGSKKHGHWFVNHDSNMFQLVVGLYSIINHPFLSYFTVFATDPSDEATGVYLVFRLEIKAKKSTYNSWASFPDREAHDPHQKICRRIHPRRCGRPNTAGTNFGCLERNWIPSSDNQILSIGAARCWIMISHNSEMRNTSTH